MTAKRFFLLGCIYLWSFTSFAQYNKCTTVSLEGATSAIDSLYELQEMEWERLKLLLEKEQQYKAGDTRLYLQYGQANSAFWDYYTTLEQDWGKPWQLGQKKKLVEFEAEQYAHNKEHLKRQYVFQLENSYTNQQWTAYQIRNVDLRIALHKELMELYAKLLSEGELARTDVLNENAHLQLLLATKTQLEFDLQEQQLWMTDLLQSSEWVGADTSFYDTTRLNISSWNKEVDWQNKPDIAALKVAQDKFVLASKLKKQEQYLPTLGTTFFYQQIDHAGNLIGVGVSLDFPLFFQKRGVQLKGVQLSSEANTKKIQTLEQAYKRRWNSAFARWLKLKEMREGYTKQILPLYKQIVEQEKFVYENGKKDKADYLKAQAQYIEMELVHMELIHKMCLEGLLINYLSN